MTSLIGDQGRGKDSDEPTGVLHLISRDQRRGAESVALFLARALADRCTQDIVALAPGLERVELGVETLTTHSRRIRLIEAGSVPALARRLRRRRPDIVLAHGGQAARVAILSAAVVRPRPKVVWQRILHFPPVVWRSPLRKTLWRLTAQRVSGVVALTRRTASEMDRLRYRGPIWVIPNHRPLKQYGPASVLLGQFRREIGASDRDTLIGFVGHLVPQKDPLRFIRVASRVLAADTDTRAVILGDGPLRGPVERAVASTGCAERFHVLGHRQDIVPALADIDLVVSVSQMESMTGALVEALMGGCAVVTLPTDGMDRLLTPRCGLVVEDSDEALEAAIHGIICDRGRLSAFKANARARGALFSTERVASAYWSALTTVVSGGAQRSPMEWQESGWRTLKLGQRRW